MASCRSCGPALMRAFLAVRDSNIDKGRKQFSTVVAAKRSGLSRAVVLDRNVRSRRLQQTTRLSKGATMVAAMANTASVPSPEPHPTAVPAWTEDQGERLMASDWDLSELQALQDGLVVSAAAWNSSPPTLPALDVEGSGSRSPTVFGDGIVDHLPMPTDRQEATMPSLAEVEEAAVEEAELPLAPDTLASVVDGLDAELNQLLDSVHDLSQV